MLQSWATRTLTARPAIAGRAVYTSYAALSFSASVLRYPSDDSEYSSWACSLSLAWSTGSPAKDSAVETTVPDRAGWKAHSWMPMIPPEAPPQRMREPASSAYTVEVTVKPKLVQL